MNIKIIKENKESENMKWKKIFEQKQTRIESSLGIVQIVKKLLYGLKMLIYAYLLT